MPAPLSSVKHLVGHFNSHLRDACFLFADEAGDKSGERASKRCITEPTLTIEPKGVDVMTVPDMLHVFDGVERRLGRPGGEHERRFVVLAVAEHKREDDALVHAPLRALEDGGYGAMLHDPSQIGSSETGTHANCW